AEATLWHRQRLEGDTLEKRGKAMREEATAKLLAALGPAEVGRLPGVDLTYVRTVVARESYVVNASSYVTLSTRTARLPGPDNDTPARAPRPPCTLRTSTWPPGPPCSSASCCKATSRN